MISLVVSFAGVLFVFSVAAVAFTAARAAVTAAGASVAARSITFQLFNTSTTLACFFDW